MSRLFTFGCSFTNYKWPTWADLLGREFNDFFNYGRSGAGNLYISTSIAEASIKHNINNNDTVIVMWSSFTRADQYKDNEWVTNGNVLNFLNINDNLLHDELSFNLRGCYIRDLAQIFLTYHFLQNIGCKFYFLSMLDISATPYEKNPKYFNENIKDVIEFYTPILKHIRPSVVETIFNNNWNSRKIVIEGKNYPRGDRHPLPLEHLEYIEKILPEFTISQATKDFAATIENDIMQCIKNKIPYKGINKLGERL